MAELPHAFRTLTNEIRKIKDELRAIRSSSPFFGTGMHPNGVGGLDSDNFVTDVSGYRLAETPEFNDLKLRGGIIGNDALTDPVVPGVHKVNATGFSVTLSWVEVVGGNVTVPAGCTRLLATSSVWVYAINPNTTGGNNGTGGDTLWCYVDIGGSAGEVFGLGLSGSNGYTTSTSGSSVLKTGLTPGGTVRISGMASSSYASFGSNAFNTATISTTLLWLR